MAKAQTKAGADILQRLAHTIAARAEAGAAQSYTVQLIGSGKARIAQKLGEEAVETLIAALENKDGKNTALIKESADMLYHWLVLLYVCGCDADSVWQELARRMELGKK